MFEDFPKSKFEIVGSDGHLRGETNAIHTPDEIIVLDERMVIQVGDEMRRHLPNGTDETFEVLDPHFQEETFGIPAHFRVKVRRKGNFPHHSGGNYNITVSGPNARVNVGSTDQSTNVATSTTIFGHLAEAIDEGVADETDRRTLLAAVEKMKSEQGGGGFLTAYQNFMSIAADHLGVIGPFLPALSRLLAG